MYYFSVGYDSNDIYVILDIHKYLTKTIFRLIKQVFISLLNFSGFLERKCGSLNKEPCMARPIFTDLNPIELTYYPFVVILGKCNGSLNFVDDLFTKLCVPSETKYVNVKIVNTITRINKSKTLVKHISCGFKCKFNSTTCNSNQQWNNDTCQCECKKYGTCKKGYSWDPSTCICENIRHI